jgi:hypothetical protein
MPAPGRMESQEGISLAFAARCRRWVGVGLTVGSHISLVRAIP